MHLPAGLTHRPLRTADAAAAADVARASELVSTGEAVTETADLLATWQRPGFDTATATIGVFDDAGLVAWAHYCGSDRAEADVHPAYTGRGIGTALAGWVRDTARAADADIVGMPVPTGSAGERLLLGLGFRPRWHSWVLGLPEGAEILAPPLPQGWVVRAAYPSEYRQCWQVTEDAFLEWSRRARRTYADWAATTTDRPGFQQWQLRVAVTGEGTVSGVCLVQVADGCAFVANLAVRRAERGQGLARALLADTFRTARQHGAPRAELSTDSRTGALGLYERLGMVVTSTWVHLAAQL